MTFRVRALGSIALAALIALSATTVDAATTKRSKRTTVHRTVAAKKTTVRKKRRARARKPPAGGVYSRHAVVFDPVTNEVLYEKNAARTVPIASITKLMTALVFLDQDPDLSKSVEITRTEITGGGKTQLRRGEEVALGDLLHMSLMCSDNVATRALAKGAGISEEEFLSQMNRKALELGLTDTRFVEFTGLDERNVSTATDVAKLLRAASDVDMIRSISTTRSYEFRTESAPHYIGNTNRLLYSRYEILGGKTGFISEAGYCLVTWVRTGGRDLIAVVLGAPTNATRFADVVRLVQRTVTPTVASTN